MYRLLLTAVGAVFCALGVWIFFGVWTEVHDDKLIRAVMLGTSGLIIFIGALALVWSLISWTNWRNEGALKEKRRSRVGGGTSWT